MPKQGTHRQHLEHFMWSASRTAATPSAPPLHVFRLLVSSLTQVADRSPHITEVAQGLCRNASAHCRRYGHPESVVSDIANDPKKDNWALPLVLPADPSKGKSACSLQTEAAPCWAAGQPSIRNLHKGLARPTWPLSRRGCEGL